jgi:predicted MPP superfamily phosphohydrolase
MNNIYHPKLKHALRYMMTVTTFLLLSGCASVPSKTSRNPFTIIVLPDTQLYSLQHPEIFVGQTQWIKAHKDELNIVCVIHEGDITHKNTPTEWENADRAMSLLDGVVPYCMVMGNHDYAPGKPLKRSSADLFNKHFGSSRFEKEPWYGGHFGDGNENAYYRIHAGGMDFLIVCLEFGPRDEVLEWANRLVSKHSDYRTVVVTNDQ